MAASKRITGASRAAIGRVFAFSRLHRWFSARFSCGENCAPEIAGVVYLHGDGAVERRQFAVINRVKIVQVLLGADQAAGCRFACQPKNFVVVVIGVPVMVGEEFVADDIQAPSAQVIEECGWIADAAEGEKFWKRIGGDGAGGLAFGDAMDGVELWPRVENWGGGIAADGGFDRGGAGVSGDYDYVGAGQGGAGFAEVSGGEEAAATERIGCVDEDDVNVAGELQVLEAVVEDEPIHAALG